MCGLEVKVDLVKCAPITIGRLSVESSDDLHFVVSSNWWRDLAKLKKIQSTRQGCFGAVDVSERFTRGNDEQKDTSSRVQVQNLLELNSGTHLYNWVCYKVLRRKRS